jgi:hypothetical protein
MNSQARQKLIGLIAQYGSTVCGTPAMCGTLIRGQLGDFPSESKYFITALNAGVVKQIMALSNGEDWATVSRSTARPLVEKGLTPDQAHWTVDSWGLALGKHPDAGSLPLPAAPAPPAKTEQEQEWLAPRRYGPRAQMGMLEVLASMGVSSQKLMIGVLVLGGAILALGIYMKDEGTPFAERGVLTEGHVVSCEIVGVGRRGRPEYEVTYTYTVDEQEYELVGISSIDRELGETVKITYLKDDPKTAKLGEPTKWLTAGNMLIGTGGLLLGVAAALLGGSIYARSKAKPEAMPD